MKTGREQVRGMYFFLPRFFISRETDGKIRKRLPAERRAADNFPEIESLGIIIRKKQSLYSRLQGKFNTKYQNCRDMSLERSAERDENYFYTEYGFQDSKTKRLTPRSITNETIFHLFGSRFIEYIGSSPFHRGGKFRDRKIFPPYPRYVVISNAILLAREPSFPRSSRKGSRQRVST